MNVKWPITPSVKKQQQQQKTLINPQYKHSIIFAFGATVVAVFNPNHNVRRLLDLFIIG